MCVYVRGSCVAGVGRVTGGQQDTEGAEPRVQLYQRSRLCGSAGERQQTADPAHAQSGQPGIAHCVHCGVLLNYNCHANHEGNSCMGQNLLLLANFVLYIDFFSLNYTNKSVENVACRS